jgi:hypothetical protein
MARHFIPADNMEHAYRALLGAIPGVAVSEVIHSFSTNGTEARAWDNLTHALHRMGIRTYHQDIWDQRTGVVLSDPSQGLRFSTFPPAPWLRDPSLPNTCTSENRRKATAALDPYVVEGSILDL